MGHLQKFHEKYGKEGLLVFTIAMQKDVEATKKTTQERKWDYPIFNGFGSPLGDQFAYG